MFGRALQDQLFAPLVAKATWHKACSPGGIAVTPMFTSSKRLPPPDRRGLGYAGCVMRGVPTRGRCLPRDTDLGTKVTAHDCDVARTGLRNTTHDVFSV